MWFADFLFDRAMSFVRVHLYLPYLKGVLFQDARKG